MLKSKCVHQAPIPIATTIISTFAPRLITWQRSHGRHHLPWQVTDPYRIWLSEIMLQQTQVHTVLSYYERFVTQFPNIVALANAPLDEVLTLWSGLGYYHRAHRLHRTAQIIVSDFQGRFPTARQTLETLPGIGRSTAGAIAVFAAHQKEAILDGNVKRILARVFGIEALLSRHQTTEQLWQLAQQLLPNHHDDMVPYTQGLMDLGTMICKHRQPDCATCPMQDICLAALQHKTDSIPAKPVRIPRPVRYTTMLLICYKCSVYLEKRPPNGIWGGLWTFPAFDNPQAAWPVVHALDVHPLPPAWPTIMHIFTHFRLVISPQMVKVHAATPSLDQLPGRWVTYQTVKKIAIPAPVLQLLERLFRTANPSACD